MDVGHAGLVWNIDRPAYMDVGHAGLVWPVNAPCITAIPNIPVGPNTDRPAYDSRAITLLPHDV